MKVCEVMTTAVMTMRPQESFKDAVDRIIAFDVSGLPVVDDVGRLVGIVTEADLIPKPAYGGQSRRLLRLLVDVVSREDHQWLKSVGSTVGDVMSTDLIVAEQDEDLAVAARRMLTAKVKRLPVVDSAGRLVGIVSRQDLLGVYLRPDVLIRDDVLAALADPARSPEDADIEVTVAEGVVRLLGSVLHPSDVRVVESAVWRVSGVIGVVTDLVARSPEPTLGAMMSVI